MHILEPGQMFAGRYRIERLLAQGGMGAVFVAEQVATELRVALKVLWPHVLASQDAIKKFQFEARVAARVESEHIVKVFDAGWDENTRFPFLVMELLKGRSLEEHLEASGPVPLAEAATYMLQVASALDRAHQLTDRQGIPQPIIHRDLKPDNLFLTRRESGEPLIKILDFGIAKVLSETTDVTKEVKGTPLYMAYEQAAGEKVTAQTDIWALGLIAFTLLTGKSYWKTPSNPEGTGTALFAEILSMDLVAPSQRLEELGGGPALPPGFDTWFSHCVHRDQQQRFRTAGETARVLADIAQIPIQARPMYYSQLTPGQGAVAAKSPWVDSDSAMAKSYTRNEAGAPRSRRRWFGLAGGVLVVGTGVAGLALKYKESAQQPTVQALSGQPAPSYSSRVEVTPATATVRVDGRTMKVTNGSFTLRGPGGKSFMAEVSHGSAKRRISIVLDEHGIAHPSKIELPTAPAEPPMLDAAASQKRPKPPSRPRVSKKPKPPPLTPRVPVADDKLTPPKLTPR